MEVACGEHGDCIPKLVMAVNSGKCNNLNQKQQQDTASAIKTCVANDIVKEDIDSKWKWSIVTVTLTRVLTKEIWKYVLSEIYSTSLSLSHVCNQQFVPVLFMFPLYELLLSLMLFAS